MSLQPNYRVCKENDKFTANKQFTDREFYREVFDHKIDNIIGDSNASNKHYVLMYYGIAGVGKSSLLRQLRFDLLKKYKNATYSTVDFRNKSFQDPARALFEVRNSFSEKVRFPHFDQAYSIYFKKKNPDLVPKVKNLPYEAEASILGSVISAIDGFGIAGAITGIVSKLYGLINKLSIHKSIRASLKDLEEFNLPEIEERLPAYLAYDFQVIKEKNSNSVNVIFLDTFDGLWECDFSEKNKYSKDSWIRELIKAMPGVLFVICGRESLNWSTLEPEWQDVLDQFNIECFDSSDAERFLLLCGIRESDIREKIIQASSGHPYHLDLSVDTYVKLRNNSSYEIRPENFGSTRREILDRFIYNLDRTEVEALKTFSIARFYTDEIFVYLCHEFNLGLSRSEFGDFNRYSFISKQGVKYFLHTLMRDGLIFYIDGEYKRAVHESLSSFYENKIINSNVESQESLTEFLSEATFHKRNCVDRETFLSWINKDKITLFRDLQLTGNSRFLLDYLASLYNDFGQDRISQEVFIIYIDMLHLSGQFIAAAEMIQDFLSKYDFDTIITSNILLHLYIRAIHHQMFYMPVKPLIDCMLNIETLVNKNKLPERYNEILFMLGGNLGVLQGNYQFCVKWLIKSLRFARNNGFPEIECRTLRKLADILRSRGHLMLAEQICIKGLDIARSKKYTRYEIYLMCSLGEIFRCKKSYVDALELFNKAEKLAIKQGIKPWIGHANLAIAETYISLKDISKSNEFQGQAREIYNKISHNWGIIQCDIVEIRKLLIQNNSLWLTKLLETRDRAAILGYSNELKILENIEINREALDNKLMFL